MGNNMWAVCDVKHASCRLIIIVLCLHIHRANEGLVVFACCRVDPAARSGKELRCRVLLRRLLLLLIESIHMLSARAHGETGGRIVAERTRQARFLLMQQFAVLHINLIGRLLLLIHDAGRGVLPRARLNLRHINAFPADLVGDV